MKVPLESEEQKTLIKWFRLKHPAIRYCLWAVPNGSFLAGTQLQRAKQMNRLKAEGFATGTADLFLMVPAGDKHGLFIEMKRQKFTPSAVGDEQLKFQALATSQGYEAVICGGWIEASAVIGKYLAKSNLR